MAECLNEHAAHSHPRPRPDPAARAQRRSRRAAGGRARRCHDAMPLHAAVAEPDAHPTRRRSDGQGAAGRARRRGADRERRSPQRSVVAAAIEIGYPDHAEGARARTQERVRRGEGRPRATPTPSPAALAAMPAAERYLVEATVTDVVAEVLVAVRRDPPIGWLVTLGFGGRHHRAVERRHPPARAGDRRRRSPGVDQACAATRC